MNEFDCAALYALTEREKTTLKVEAELYALYTIIRDNFELMTTLEDHHLSPQYKISLLGKIIKSLQRRLCSRRITQPPAT